MALSLRVAESFIRKTEANGDSHKTLDIFPITKACTVGEKPLCISTHFLQWRGLFWIGLSRYRGSFRFSLLSGCVYVINDWQDRAEDRLHRVKKYRPIAADLVGRVVVAIFRGLDSNHSINKAFEIPVHSCLIWERFYSWICVFSGFKACADLRATNFGQRLRYPDFIRSKRRFTDRFTVDVVRTGLFSLMMAASKRSEKWRTRRIQMWQGLL